MQACMDPRSVYRPPRGKERIRGHWGASKANWDSIGLIRP